jgi:hypothetical protein
MNTKSHGREPHERITRRVYGYYDSDNTLVYIGSSYCALSTLEYNHRNALTKYIGEQPSTFRTALATTDLSNGTFKTLLEIEGINQLEIEDLEGQLIRSFAPRYNIDKNPVRKSIIKKRYDENSIAVPSKS